MAAKKIRKRLSQSRPIWLTFVGVAWLVLLIALLLRGTNIELLNPKGTIAGEQRHLMVLALALLLEIAVPTLILFYFTAWKYRESNEKATYDPDAKRNKSVVFSLWAAPTITMLLLASIMWPATHQLAPQRSISNGVEPLTIQVIAMRWKWLFIYPAQNIATINFIQLPIDQPVQFDITADEIPMSSFWIPQLGGQLYAMTGHVNRMNLMADKAGDFAGSSTEINGSGFAGMKFTARAGSLQDFNLWVLNAKQSPSVLDITEYQKLLVPSESNKATYYSQTEPYIYDNLLAKYADSHAGHTEHE